jgi:hypothetical protein
MLDERVRLATDFLVQQLKLFAPIDTGNLMSSIVRVEDLGTPFKHVIYIGGGIVEYAPATNEKWESPKWKGKRNPNQGWVQKAIRNALPVMRQIMSGGMTQEDANRMINSKASKVQDKMVMRADELLVQGKVK